MSTLSDIIDAIQPDEIRGETDGVDITAISLDSRSVTPGALYACVRGATSDGHDFAADAVSAGAVALIVEQFVDDVDVPQLQVESTRPLLGAAATTLYGSPADDLDVFAVTGTNGKTTVTHILRSILSAAGHTPGMIGTIGAWIGDTQLDIGFTTPEAPELQRVLRQMADAECDSVTMEVSSHALDQHRIDRTRLAAVGFTNLTRDHLDYHTGFEPYFMAKRRLFTMVDNDGFHTPAAVNVDDEWGNRLFDELVHVEREDVPVWGYTTKDMARASVSAKYLLTDDGANVTIESPVGDFDVKSPLRGRFNVENVLCAACLALLAGITPEHIQEGVAQIEGVPGRFEPVDEGQAFQVVVDYAHTPDSLENVLRAARELTDGEVIIVFGCGGDRDRSKRPLMGQAAAELADLAIVTSDNPRSEDPKAILREIVVGMRGASAEVKVEVDRRTAIELAIESAEPGDVVLIAGKGHEQGQEFADETIAFDDATVARESLNAVTAG